MPKRSFAIVLLIFFLTTHPMHSQQPSDLNYSSLTTISVRLKPGDDLKQSLDKIITDHKIKAACIITCVGSLEKVMIRFANKPEANSLIGKFEIVSLTGTLSTSGSHVHISISDETGRTFGGQLKE